MNKATRDHLKSFIERIERLEEEKKALADDIKDVYAEAKGNGFDVKALRTIIKMRKQDADERREHEAMVELYMQALGMLENTPLERAADDRVQRARARAAEAAADTAELAQEMAAAGMISPEAAEESAAIARGLAKRAGHQIDLEEAIAAKGEPSTTVKAVAQRKLARTEERANRAVKRHLKAFGRPVPLTEEEKAKGYGAAFIDKRGNRCAIGVDVKK